MKKKSMTLLELMVAVCILAIGITYILRSFIGSASALNYYEDKRHALMYLEEKMATVEQSIFMGTYSDLLANRVESFSLRGVVDAQLVTEISESKLQDQEIDSDQNAKSELKLYNLTMKVIWTGKSTENIQQLETAFAFDPNSLEGYYEQ